MSRRRRAGHVRRGWPGPGPGAAGGGLTQGPLSPQAFPDNAARREVESLPAVCPSEGCSWKGTLKEYEVGAAWRRLRLRGVEAAAAGLAGRVAGSGVLADCGRLLGWLGDGEQRCAWGPAWPERHMGEESAFSLLGLCCLLAEQVLAGGRRSGLLVSPGVTGRRLDEVPATRAVAGCISCGPSGRLGHLCASLPLQPGLPPCRLLGGTPGLACHWRLSSAGLLHGLCPQHFPMAGCCPQKTGCPCCGGPYPGLGLVLRTREPAPGCRGRGLGLSRRGRSQPWGLARGLRAGSATGQSGWAQPEAMGLVCVRGLGEASGPYSPPARLQGPCSLLRAARTTEQPPSSGVYELSWVST